MKKFVLGISALALLAGSFGLASCSGGTSSDTSSVGTDTSSVTDSSVVESSSSSSSSSTTSSGTISLNSSSSLTLEVGGTYTLRATISGDFSDFTSTFTCDNEDVIEMPSRTEGVSSCRITAVGVGTATITVTATADPTLTTTCVVTVEEAKPTPDALFESVNAVRNYTLTAEVTYGGQYLVTEYTYLTEDFLVQYDDYNGDSEGGYYPLWNSSTNSGSVMLGMFIDDNDYATYLEYATTGETDENDTLILGNQTYSGMIESQLGGFLTAQNFDGLGLTNMSPYYADLYFSSLSAIDTSWLPSDKESDNVYDLNYSSSDSDYSLGYVEYLLLKAFAPSIHNAVISSVATGGYYYFYDIALAVDTTLTITDTLDFVVTFTWGDYTINCTISNIGTTTAADVDYLPNLASDITGYTATRPDLNSELADMKAAFEGNDYVHITTSYFNNTAYYYYIYYTADYFFAYYPQEWVDAYNSYYGSYYGYIDEPYGLGLYLDDGDVFFFEAEIENGSLTNIVTEKLTGNYVFGTVTDLADLDIYTLLGYANYYTNTSAGLDEDYFYYFSSTTSQIWSSDTTTYHTSYNVEANRLSMDLVWGYDIQGVEDDDITITGIRCDYSSGAISTIEYSFGWYAYTMNGNDYYSVSSTSYTDFGNADEANLFSDDIYNLIGDDAGAANDNEADSFSIGINNAYIGLIY